MKKLEKLRLNDLKEISSNEQKSLTGGGAWVLEADGQYYWSFGDVEVAAYQDITCPRCEQNEEYGIVSNDENQRFWVNTVKEFFANTLPHLLGCGGHINDDYTIYRYRLEGSDWTDWRSGY
jgi:natural product precursor